MQKRNLNVKNMMKMGSKKKGIKQFDKFDLSPIKLTDNKNHLYADYIELISFFNSDETTLNEVLNRFSKDGIKINQKKKTTTSDVGLDDYEIEDSDELWLKDIFNICKNRSSILKLKYPFDLKNNSIILKKDLTDIQKIYLMLLLSSNLNYFPNFESDLTIDFEIVSYYSLKNFLPSNAIVKKFGKKTDYTGLAKDKIKALGKDLNVFVNDSIIDKNVNGIQERGLDLIGWIPFNDKVANMIVLYCQCACGKEWFKNQGETKRYENSYYPFFKQKPINTMFIPYALIENDNSFFQEDEIDSLLFERHRILENISNPIFYDDLSTKIIIEKCLKYSLDII